MFLFIFETEKDSMSRRGAERGGDTEFEAGSRLRAVSTEPDAGLELMNREITTWADVRQTFNRLSHSRAPKKLFGGPLGGSVG